MNTFLLTVISTCNIYLPKILFTAHVFRRNITKHIHVCQDVLSSNTPRTALHKYVFRVTTWTQYERVGVIYKVSSMLPSNKRRNLKDRKNTVAVSFIKSRVTWITSIRLRPSLNVCIVFMWRTYIPSNKD